MIFSLVDGRADAWQWDTGLSLNVDTSEYQISEVHMSNSSTKGAFVCEIKPDRTVEIPNILLTTDGDINIYAIISDEEGERTVIKERLHVHRKKKPQDYVYTETEVYEYKDYIARLAAVENTVVRAGAVYTLPPDEEADVNIRVITNEDGSLTYYIDFYIPEGQQGEPGVPGDPGSPGINGKTPYIQGGYWYIDGVNLGVKAEGTPGTSVTITRIIESTESGGTNTVEFSDGSRLNVRNGKDGEDGEGGGGGVIEETDPTVPNWAKQPNKPSYTKSEVGLGNVDNVKQYSANNPPPYPVTSVNGKTGAVTVDVPTKTSELDNDSGFITKTVSDLTNYYLKSETFSKAEINALVSAIPKFAIEVVSTLPTSNISATTVYLLKDGTGGDLYTEYIYTNGAWEILGSQRVDLTGYALKEDIPTKLSDLDNDAGYITKAVSDLVNYYKKSEVYSKDEIDKKGFLTEHQDISGKLDASKLPEAVNSALAQAKASGDFDGEDGKSAYKYAQDGGYTGTEEEFAEKLAFLMGYSVYGYVDENNNIIIKGNIADGSYIKYEMEDGTTIDIGQLVLDNNVYYSVTSDLTNCTNSNSDTQAIGGESYSATITANSGYELSSVVVTMGGTDVTDSAVSGGTIRIAEVTGDIVITAVAEEVKAPEPVTQSYTITKGMSIVTGTGTDRTGTDVAAFCATPHIDVSNIPKPCTINLTKAKWCYADTSGTGYIRFYVTNTSGAKITGGYSTPDYMPEGVTMTINDSNCCDVTVTVTSNNIGTIRFAGDWSNSHVSENNNGTICVAEATLTYTPNS